MDLSNVGWQQRCDCEPSTAKDDSAMVGCRPAKIEEKKREKAAGRNV